jgi:hypothetical protein
LKKQSGLLEAGQHHPEDGSSLASLARDASFLLLDFASVIFPQSSYSTDVEYCKRANQCFRVRLIRAINNNSLVV